MDYLHIGARKYREKKNSVEVAIFINQIAQYIQGIGPESKETGAGKKIDEKKMPPVSQMLAFWGYQRHHHKSLHHADH